MRMVSAGEVLDDGMSFAGNRVSIARAGGHREGAIWQFGEGAIWRERGAGGPGDWSCHRMKLISLGGSGSRGTRADQGVRPTNCAPQVTAHPEIGRGRGGPGGLVMPPNEVDFVGGKGVRGAPRGPGGPPHELCASGDGASGVAPRHGMHGDAVAAISLGLIEGVVGFADEGFPGTVG